MEAAIAVDKWVDVHEPESCCGSQYDWISAALDSAVDVVDHSLDELRKIIGPSRDVVGERLVRSAVVRPNEAIFITQPNLNEPVVHDLLLESDELVY